jgi:hypothetical protein
LLGKTQRRGKLSDSDCKYMGMEAESGKLGVAVGTALEPPCASALACCRVASQVLIIRREAADMVDPHVESRADPPLPTPFGSPSASATGSASRMEVEVGGLPRINPPGASLERSGPFHRAARSLIHRSRP